ncbi:hypothetical protein MJ570_00575 [Escherichia coli]|nr:hypothetical protein MJ570_00575 [Escherichia coli]
MYRSAGTAEEPAENFGQVAIFVQPVVDDCQMPTIPRLTLSGNPQKLKPCYCSLSSVGDSNMGEMVAQWRTQCNPRLLHRCVGICSVYSSAGEGSARVPGRDAEFWYEEELRQKAPAGTATTRQVFFLGN